MIYPYVTKIEKILSFLTGYGFLLFAIAFILGLFKQYSMFIVLVYFKIVLSTYLLMMLLIAIICFKILKKHGVIDGLDLITNEEEQSKH